MMMATCAGKLALACALKCDPCRGLFRAERETSRADGKFQAAEPSWLSCGKTCFAPSRLQGNSLLPRRADRNDGQFGASQFGERLQVGTGARRHILPAPNPGGGLFPSREIDVNRLALAEQSDIVRHVIERFAADPIT